MTWCSSTTAPGSGRSGTAPPVRPAWFMPLPSIAYRLARVAVGDGVATLTLRPVNALDVVAGHALLLAAGGVLVAEDGAPVTYSEDGGSRPSACFGGAPEAVATLRGAHLARQHGASAGAAFAAELAARGGGRGAGSCHRRHAGPADRRCARRGGGQAQPGTAGSGRRSRAGFRARIAGRRARRWRRPAAHGSAGHPRGRSGRCRARRCRARAVRIRWPARPPPPPSRRVWPGRGKMKCCVWPVSRADPALAGALRGAALGRQAFSPTRRARGADLPAGRAAGCARPAARGAVGRRR